MWGSSKTRWGLCPPLPFLRLLPNFSPIELLESASDLNCNCRIPRTSSVVFGGGKSCVVYIVCSVSRGSVIGSLLFILYLVDLMGLVEKYVENLHAYSDDTQLYRHFRRNDVTVDWSSASLSSATGTWTRPSGCWPASGCWATFIQNGSLGATAIAVLGAVRVPSARDTRHRA